MGGAERPAGRRTVPDQVAYAAGRADHRPADCRRRDPDRLVDPRPARRDLADLRLERRRLHPEPVGPLPLTRRVDRRWCGGCRGGGGYPRKRGGSGGGRPPPPGPSPRPLAFKGPPAPPPPPPGAPPRGGP